MNKENQKEVKKLPGFYIALCCCVLVIGIAGYFTERHTDKASSVINTEIAQEEATEKPVYSADTSKYTAAAISTPAPAAAESADNTVTENIPVVSQPQEIEEYAVDNPDVEESAVIVSSQQPTFIMPVSGNILEGFSESLMYNTALSDWRTHNGIDIAAEKGCSVQAAADGVIDSITTDAMGGCVEISHAAGFVTRYRGLENVENLTEGKEIHSGEVIGTLGDCKVENVTDSHLHFEMEKDGSCVNPSDYLPQQ